MNLVRLCEWSRRPVLEREWPRAQREALLQAAQAWRETHRLNALPLEWGGPDGCTLQARQWVGVVEIEGGRVEIYPKTDAALLNKNAPDDKEVGPTLRALLRLLDASAYDDWVETDVASLDVRELTFLDLWAYLLGKHLWPQLRRGLPSAYLPQEDALPTVRGRILVGPQLARFGERLDRIVCAWDEFSPDIALLRLLKCACRFLRRRVRHPVALGLLGDCLFMLDDVADVPPVEVLRGVERLVWTRATERFRPTFNLARRILQGQGPHLGAGHEATWVFLVDMNRVFESFCRVALEARLGVVVEEQQTLGWLLHQPSRQRQIADYVWSVSGRRWIGDAKWKLLSGPLLDEDEDKADPARLSTADVRQLTTYAELQRLQSPGEPLPPRSELAIFYPALTGGAVPTHFQTWNHTRLHLVPLQIGTWKSPPDALPTAFRCS